ncbi:MAG: LPP20 family lipoprotein [Gallionellaceae bacterium]|nr:LPP20 family lipoprotein [Gallionellaceae bacterium]
MSSPSWVLNPEKAGFISVVGAAPQQDWGGRDAQFRVALKKAHQELAQMVRVQVQSSSRFKSETSKAGLTQDADVETRLQSNVGLSLDAARVIEEWTDPQSGVLYIWLVTPN